MSNSENNDAIVRSIIPSMSNDNAYPETVEESIDDGIKYRLGVIPALKRWRDKKLWGSKTNRQRLEGLTVLAQELSPLYDIEVPSISGGGIDLDATVRETKMNQSGSSCYVPALHEIIMSGNLSIITFLHEFGHALGKNEKQTCRWSINLFKRVFPKQFAKLDHSKHTLIRHRPRQEDIDAILNS